jgi:predicted acylesterase/phospholipase RssA
MALLSAGISAVKDQAQAVQESVDRFLKAWIPIRRTIGKIARTFYLLRASLISAAIGFCALALPAQTLDIYRSVAEKLRLTDLSFYTTSITILLCCGMIWYAGALLCDKHAFTRAEARTKRTVRLHFNRQLLSWLPPLFAIAPMVGLLVGFFRAAATMPKETPAFRQLSDSLQIYGTLAIVPTIVVGLALVKWRDKANVTAGSQLFSRSGTLIIAAVTFVLIASIVSLANTLGAIAVLCLFLVVLTVWLSLATHWGRVLHFPLLSCLLVVAFIFDMLGLHDNHAVRLSANAHKPGDYKTLEENFAEWVKSRGDLDHFKGRPYPIFIISAQGGGIYAAEHAALVLAGLQDRCQNFSQHVYAISGVSGGSLGAGIFSALARQDAVNGPWQPCRRQIRPTQDSPAAVKREGDVSFRQNVKDILGHDFLSPLVAAALFRDLFPRFVPAAIHVFGVEDRARALENEFEQSWARWAQARSRHDAGAQANPLAEPFMALWNSAPVNPMLILNTTEVETGRRRLIAPFLLSKPVPSGEAPYLYMDTTATLADFNSEISLPLSTALTLSARFPYLTPPGRVENKRAKADKQPGSLHLVDGGYFENSGMTTAYELRAVLENFSRNSASPVAGMALEFYILQIGDGAVQPETIQSVSELSPPIETLFRTRGARGEGAVLQAHFLTTQTGDRNPVDDKVRTMLLAADDYALPLGWFLSSASTAIIEKLAGFPEACADPNSGIDRRLHPAKWNDCIALKMIMELDPDFQTRAP